MSSKDHLIVFDTTLRDGEQSPGASMTRDEKVRIAKALEKLRVDVIEAGFPIASPGDFEGVKAVAAVIKDSRVCGLARALDKDIDSAGEALAGANAGRIHTFIATSPIHMEKKLRHDPGPGGRAGGPRGQARPPLHRRRGVLPGGRGPLGDRLPVPGPGGGDRRRGPHRQHPGHRGLQHPRSVRQPSSRPCASGYPTPTRPIFSVHCHNDLGLATANSLAAVRNGARQVECTINGLGERAGNAALEEIVMAVRTRQDLFACDTRLDTTQIVPCSRLVSGITGFPVQPNKAVVGANAFAHEAGIHQDGVLKHRETYEIMRAEDVGWNANRMVLGKHSGRNAFRSRLQELGVVLGSEEELNAAFSRFKDLADKKHEIFDEDLQALVTDANLDATNERVKLVSLRVCSETGETPQADLVTLMVDGEEEPGSGHRWRARGCHLQGHRVHRQQRDHPASSTRSTPSPAAPTPRARSRCGWRRAGASSTARGRTPTSSLPPPRPTSMPATRSCSPWSVPIPRPGTSEAGAAGHDRPDG